MSCFGPIRLVVHVFLTITRRSDEITWGRIVQLDVFTWVNNQAATHHLDWIWRRLPEQSVCWASRGIRLEADVAMVLSSKTRFVQRWEEECLGKPSKSTTDSHFSPIRRVKASEEDRPGHYYPLLQSQVCMIDLYSIFHLSDALSWMV